MVGLLSMPVFAYLPRVQKSALQAEQLNDCSKVLAWTAPFAVLALYRCVQRCNSDTALDIEADSMELEEADDGIVTDMEEFGEEPEQALSSTHVSDNEQDGGRESGEEGQGQEQNGEDWLAFSMSAIRPEDLDED
jgi:hypothetical protein